MLTSNSNKCSNCKYKREVVQEHKEGLKVPEIAKLSNSMTNSNSSRIINKVNQTEQLNRKIHKIKVQEVVLAQLSVKFHKEIVYHKCHSNMLPNNKLKL